MEQSKGIKEGEVLMAAEVCAVRCEGWSYYCWFRRQRKGPGNQGMWEVFRN